MRKLLATFIILISILGNAQITIGNGTAAANIPFTGYYAYSYSQSIYPKSSIGNTGNITGLNYKPSSSTLTFKNTDKIQVWIGHTSKTVFSSSSDFVPISSLTKVFEGTVANSGGNMTVNFTTPFAYNNVDNLVIAVNEIASGYGSTSDKFLATTAPNLSSIQAYTLFGSVPVDPSNISSSFTKTSYAQLPNISLLGISPAAVAPQCTSVLSPANGAKNVTFLPRIAYSAAAGATKYFVSVGTNPGGTDITNHYDNGTYLDYYFSEGLDPETTYYVSIFPANSYGEATGCSSSSFTTGKAVANDACSTAEQITSLPVSKSVDATYATNNDGSVTCGGKEVANDGVWYALTGDGREVTVTVAATSYWDPMITVKEGSCDAAECVASVNDTEFQGTEKAVFTTKPGTIYYINIGNRSAIDFEEGPFNLSITAGVLGMSDNGNAAVSLYPNPAKDRIYLKSGADNASAVIYNAAGQMVARTKYSNAGIDVSQLQPGVYILQYEYKDQVQRIKFIKK